MQSAGQPKQLRDTAIRATPLPPARCSRSLARLLLILLLFGPLLASATGRAQEAASSPLQEILPEATRLLERGETEQADILIGRFYRQKARELRPDNQARGAIAEALAVFLNRHGHFAGAIFYMRSALRAAEMANAADPSPADPSPIARRRALLEQYTAALVAAREPRLREAIQKIERERGPDDPALEDLLLGLGRLVMRVGRDAEAVALLERALALRKVEDNDDSEETSDLFTDLFHLYLRLTRFDDAERAAQRVIAALESREGLEANEVAAAVADAVDAFDLNGRGASGDVIQKARVRKLSAALGPHSHAAVAELKRLAERQMKQRRYAPAEETLLALIALLEAEGDQEVVARWLFELAEVYEAGGRKGDAARLAALASGLMRGSAPAVSEKAAGELEVLADAAERHIARREFVAAGPVLRQWLRRAQAEDALNKDERTGDRLTTLLQACRAEDETFKSNEAEPLVDFCLEIGAWQEERYKHDPELLAVMLTGSAGFLRAVGDADSARAKLLRAWDLVRGLSFSVDDNPSFTSPRWTAVAIVELLDILRLYRDEEVVASQWADRGDLRALGPLARAQAAQGNIDGAVRTLRRQIGALMERVGQTTKGGEPDDCCVHVAADQLATLLNRHNREVEAEIYLRDLLAEQKRKLAADDVALAFTLEALARNAGYLRRDEDAARHAREAADIRAADKMRQQAETRSRPIQSLYDARRHAETLENSDPEAALAVLRPFLLRAEEAEGPASDAAIDALQAMARTARRKRPDLALAFSRDVVARLESMTAADETDRQGGRSIGQSRRSRHFASHVEMAAALLSSFPRERAPLIGEAFKAAQGARDTAAADAVAKVAARFAAGDDGLARLVRERQDAVAAIRRIGEGMDRSARSQTASLLTERLRELDRQRRNLADADRRLAADFPRYAAFNLPAAVDVREVQKLLRPEEGLLLYLVQEERSFLFVIRPAAAELLTLSIGRHGLTTDVAELRRFLDPGINRDKAAYPADKAYALHRTILSAAEPHLTGVRHLLVVTDGALDSFPLGALVTAPPEGSDPRRHAWLARHYAVTVLPSAASLRALRSFAPASKAPQPFLGTGDPALTGRGSGRGAGLATIFRSGTVDVEAVRKLARLEDSADELRNIAQSIGVDASALLLGEAATETAIKQHDLSRYRVLAFATHGLLSGELGGNAEPALVLTPPALASREDDGLLTTSEIAQLKLDADWVLLSACNTAGPDGAPDGGGLSGLAQAFLYAGSRALLVSHWPVFSRAAVRLTTGAFAELRRDAKGGRAEALRRSMLSILDDPTLPPIYAHPMVWAPFIVVGEGGPIP